MLVLCLTLFWGVIFFALEHFLTIVPACLCYFLIAALILGISTFIASPLRKKSTKLQKTLDKILHSMFFSAIIALYCSALLLATISTIKYFLS